MSKKFPLTESIPNAGFALGIKSRSAQYRAADEETGWIPTVRLGPKLRRVPMDWLKRKLRAASKTRPRRTRRNRKPAAQENATP